MLKFKQLKTLKIATCKLCMGPPQQVVNAKKLAQIFECIPSIEHLDISENSINDDKFNEIMPSLVNMRQLKTLNLSRASISHVGFSKFLLALRN